MNFGLGIGDIVVVSGLAWRVYRACKESGEDFRRLSGELESLHVVLLETEDHLKEHTELNISRHNRLQILCDGCTNVLGELEALVKRYESLGTQAQRCWDRMRFGLKDVTDIRSRLISNTTMLNAFNVTLINSSTVRMEKMLRKYFTEVQAGLREGSVVTNPDVTETIDSPDVWVEIRRELEDVGINVAMMEENRGYITNWIKSALAESAVDECDPSLDMGEARKHSLAVTTDSGYKSAAGDVTEGANDRVNLGGTNEPSVPTNAAPRLPSTIHQGSSAVALAKANDAFEAALRKQRSERPLDDILEYMAVQPQVISSTKVKKSSDPSRMLQKFFQKDTAIIQAASDGNIEKVSKLISLGMDVNARDRWGWSALSMCGYGGHIAIARLLLDHGADLDNVDVDGDTPEGLASQRRHHHLVALFDDERAARDLRSREMDSEVPRRVDAELLR